MPSSAERAFRVVIADDDSEARDLLRSMLGRLGHEVAGVAGSLRETLAAVRETVPDLVLVDAHMPGADGTLDPLAGPSFAEEIGRERPVPVILISAHSTPELTERAAAAGILAAVSKPVSLPDLQRVIQLAMARFEDLQRLRQANLEYAELNRLLIEEIRRREEAEAALRASEALYRTLTEHVPDIVIRYDASRRFTFVSPNVTQLTGRRPEEYVGQPCIATLGGSPEEVKLIERTIDEVFELGESRDVEFVYKSARGPLVLSLRMVPELAADGSVKAVVSLCRDVTHLAHAQAALLRSQQTAALGVFTGGIAHQFNNLHSVIAGNVDLLLRASDLSPRHRERLEVVRATIGRATEIIGQLIRLNREAHLQTTAVPVRELVEAALAGERQALANDLVETIVMVPPELTVEGDISQLVSAMHHLVVNARHALLGRPRRQLTITAARVEGTIEIAFSDTGCGIPLQLQLKIMLPFFSTKGEHASATPQARVRGIGLGLAAADSIAKAHGGSLRFTSIEDQGSTFMLTLPALDIPPGDIVSPVSTVLIVDDEALIVELLADILGEGGYRVLSAETVAAGMGLLASQAIDVVLLDVNLPGENGADFLEQLSVRKLASPPAIVLTTGRIDDSVRQLAERHGVASILPKPFEVSQVLEQVAEALAGRGAAA